MTKRKVGLGIIGLGTVGTGVIKILQSHAALIEQKVGARCRIIRICDKDLRKKRTGIRYTRNMLTGDYKSLITDPDIDIIVELIGGYEPARRIVCEALQNGKHVVTANKAILSRHWNELFSLARRHHRLIYFEASVGGGIPVIQALNEGLAANRIEKIMGILNGTTNYILSKMADEGMDFKKALQQAQKAGFAETDPSFDISGKDAVHKLSILASLSVGAWVRPEDIYCEGITGVHLKDILYAREHLGLSLKLIGIVKDHAEGTEVRVHPALIPAKHPFSAVQNEYNAVFIHGDAVGDVMFYGKGAGAMAAASAVVSDIIFLARQVANQTAGDIPYVTFDKNKTVNIIPMTDVITRYYVRFTTVDKPGVLSRISGILGRHNVSIASVFQREPPLTGRNASILIVTHHAREGDMNNALKEIGRLVSIRAQTVRLRIEE